MDEFDLYSIDISKFWEADVSMDWDIVKFKKWVVEKDEVWNYIIIDGMKCREYQPWISWFVYKNIKDRYHFREWLEIWFCDNWKFKKSIIIEDSWHPMECKLIPNEVSRKLWWHLYEIEENPQIFYKNRAEKNKLSQKDEIFANINRNDLYTLKNNLDNSHDNPYTYRNYILWEDKDGKYLLVDWNKFHDFKPGMSGLGFIEFLSDWFLEPCIFLAEYKDRKMVWEWVIVSPKSIHLIRN